MRRLSTSMHSNAVGALIVLGGLFTAAAAQLSPASQTSDTQPGTQASPQRAPIYVEDADAKSEIAAAVARASKENRRVLIQWGANWCGWCHKLHALMESDAKVAHALQYEYDVVLIDVGRFDHNMDLAAGYGAELKKTGIPYLTILDGNGKVLLNQDSGVLESKEAGKQEHDPKAVLDVLTSHQADYLKAADLFQKGLDRAKSEDKVVFLHFGAPWCGYCHRLENWMARPEVASVLAKDFVDLKIDTDRTTGANVLFSKYKPNPEGIPWFAFLKPDGTVIADSDNSHGNIGFPTADEEITHFQSMLEKAAKRINAGEIKDLTTSLKPAPQAFRR